MPMRSFCSCLPSDNRLSGPYRCRSEHGEEVGCPEHVHLGDQERLRQDRHLLRPAGGSRSHEEQTLVAEFLLGKAPVDSFYTAAEAPLLSNRARDGWADDFSSADLIYLFVSGRGGTPPHSLSLLRLRSESKLSVVYPFFTCCVVVCDDVVHLPAAAALLQQLVVVRWSSSRRDDDSPRANRGVGPERRAVLGGRVSSALQRM